MKYLWRHCYQRHCIKRTYLFYVTTATMILSQVNKSCYLHTRRYVFCPKTHLIFNWCLCNRRESLLSYNHKIKIKTFFIYLFFPPWGHFFNPEEWLASSFSLQSQPYIKHYGLENKENDHQLKTFWLFNKFSLLALNCLTLYWYYKEKSCLDHS